MNCGGFGKYIYYVDSPPLEVVLDAAYYNEVMAEE
jgi:hypothetical protein